MKKKKNIYFNGSYLSSDQQKKMLGNGYKIYNTFHIWEEKTKKHKFYWLKYLIDNFFINIFSSERKKSEIQIFNSIIGCFFVDKTKNNILILHSYDIGINSFYVAKNSSSNIKKIMIFVWELIIWKFIRKRINLFDSVFVSTYDRYMYVKKNIRNDVCFLPNIVHIDNCNKNISKIKNKVFCPERIDNNKWLEIRKKIITLLQKKLDSPTFYMIKTWDEFKNFSSWINKNNINVKWLPYLNDKELYAHILSSNIVLGIFNNGALSITNMETMLLKTSIITYDKWEIIKNDINNIEEYGKKIINVPAFKEHEIKRNYEYISSVHSMDFYSKLFTSYL